MKNILVKQWCLCVMMMCAGIIVAPMVGAQTEKTSTVSGIKLYEGELTDEMIVSFLRADAKIRALRQQVNQATGQILAQENITPSMYVTIAQETQTNQQFLDKVRTIAQSVAADAQEKK